MRDLKILCENRNKWSPLSDSILRIETFEDDLINQGIVVDASKALLESVCNTIAKDLNISTLKENGQPVSYIDLVKKISENIGCVKEVTGMVRSLTALGQSLAELRNRFTVVGHGYSIYDIEENKNRLTSSAVKLLVSTTEQICIFLITVYEIEYPNTVKEMLRYEDNRDFNESIDELNEPISIGDLGPYYPSEILFNLDKGAYITELESYKQTNE